MLVVTIGHCLLVLVAKARKKKEYKKLERGLMSIGVRGDTMGHI